MPGNVENACGKHPMADVFADMRFERPKQIISTNHSSMQYRN